MTTAAVRVLTGNVFDLLPTIKPGSVACSVFSPPYWKLRSYLPKDHPNKHLELGSEPTPQLYVENMVRVMRLVRDCLASHGTCFLNVGDSYANNGGGGCTATNGLGKRPGLKSEFPPQPTKQVDIDAGNLCLIPQRLMIALQDDGWYVRSIICWHKPAPMPTSVAGWRWARCRVKGKSGERGRNQYVANAYGTPQRDSSGGFHNAPATQWSDCPGCRKCSPNSGYVLRRGSWRPTSSWEPVIMLAKSATYFSDGEPVKTPAKDATVNRDRYSRVIDDPDEQFAVKHDHETTCEGGANLRDVWTIKEPMMRLRSDLTPEQRKAVIQRLLAAGL